MKFHEEISYSLRDMCLKMDAVPVFTFFALLIFLQAQYLGLTSYNVSVTFSVHLLGKYYQSNIPSEMQKLQYHTKEDQSLAFTRECVTWSTLTASIFTWPKLFPPK